MIKIFFVLLLLNICFSSVPEYQITVTCPSKKPKAKYHCAIADNEKKNTLYYYFDVCPKGQYCYVFTKEREDGYCVPSTGRRDVGDSCNYPTECRSGKCFANKCVGLSADEKCNSHLQCDPGFFCKQSKEESGCWELRRKDQVADVDYDRCGFGLSPYQEKIGGNYTCKEWGTIENGKVVKDPKLCKTGTVDPITDRCLTIKSVESCKYSKDLGEYYARVTFNAGPKSEYYDYNCTGIWLDDSSSKQYFVDGLSSNRQTFWVKYLDLLRKYDLESLYEKKPNRYSDGGGYAVKKLRDAYFKYDYCEYLLKAKIIDTDGKVLDECAYNYLLSRLSSGYYKLGWTLLIGLLFALF